MSHPVSAIISDGEIQDTEECVRTKPTSTKGGQPGQNACQQFAKGDSLYSVPLQLNIYSQ